MVLRLVRAPEPETDDGCAGFEKCAAILGDAVRPVDCVCSAGTDESALLPKGSVDIRGESLLKMGEPCPLLRLREWLRERLGGDELEPD